MNPKITHLWNRVWHHAQQTLPPTKKQPRHQLKLAYNNMKISGFQSVVCYSRSLFMCWISSFPFFPFVYCLFLSIISKCIKTNCYKLVFPLGLSMTLKVLGLTNVYMIFFYYIDINYLNHHQINQSIGLEPLPKVQWKISKVLNPKL